MIFSHSQGLSFDKKTVYFWGQNIIFASKLPIFLEFYVAEYASFLKTANKKNNYTLFSGQYTFKDLIFEILGTRNFLNQKKSTFEA